MLKRPLISIIILNYNGTTLLLDCLESIFNSYYDNFEIILVDNASVDGSLLLAKQKFTIEPRLHIIENKANLGFPEGNNVGIRQAKGKYIVLLNNDTKVDSAWLTELVSTLESDNTIGAAQPKLLFFDGENIDSAGGFIDRFGQAVALGIYQKDSGQYDRNYDIFFAKGAALVVRRSVLEKVGLMDSSFFLYEEEIDLCWRILLSGSRVVFVHKSIVYHLGGASSANSAKKQTKSYYRKSTYLTERNTLKTLIKNYSLGSLIRVLPQYFSFNIIQFSFFLATRKLDFASAEIRAALSNIACFGDTWKKHLVVQGIRSTSDEELEKKMVPGSIRVQLFKQLYKSV